MAYNAGTAFVTVAPSFRGFQTKADAEAKKLRPIDIPATLNLDDGKAREKIAAITRPQTVNLGVNVDTGAAKSKLDALGRSRRTTINANADTGAAKAKIDAAARNRDATVNVHADTAKARAEIASLSGGSVLVNVGLALAPIAGPLAAVLGGGAAALGGIAAGVGAGVVGGAAVGIASIKSALDLQKKLTAASKKRVTALASVKSAEASLASAVRSSNSAQIAGARSVANAEQAGARSIISAQQSLADARRNAATVAINSARQIASAEENLDNTERQLKSSLDALHAARQQAKQDLLDLKNATQHDALSTEGAQIALVQAQQNLVQVQSTALPGSLALREAELQYKEAVLGVSDAKRQQLQDTEALNKATKEGISGAPVVKSAQQQVQQSRQAVADARRQLQQAKADASRARADAARTVSRAEVALQQARADAAKSIAQAKSDAARNLAAAHAREATARDRVAAAQGKLNKADAASAALMQRMTPMQKKLLAGIKRLKSDWQGFLNSVAGPVDGAALAGIGAIHKGLPALGNFIKPVARAGGSVFRSVGNALATPGAKGFASDFGQFSGSLIKDAGRGSINIGHALGNILKAFMPLSREMSKGLVGLTRSFAKWSDGLGKSKGFQSFIGYVRKEGPVVLDVLGKMGVVFGKILIALAPLGGLLLSGLKKVFDWLAKLTPGQLLLVGAAIGAIGIALALAFDPIVLPLTAVIGLIALFAGGLVYAYKHSAIFHKVVDKAFSVWKTVASVWFKVVKKVFLEFVKIVRDDVIPLVVRLWKNVFKPVFLAIGTAIKWAWTNVIQPALKAFWAFLKNVLFPVIGWLWTKIVKPVFHDIGVGIKVAWIVVRTVFQLWRAYMTNVLFPIIHWLYDHVVKPVMDNVGGHIHDVWVNVIKPVFIALKNFIHDYVAPAFRKGIDAITTIWDGLRAAISVPVKFVINTVWNNGLRKVINSIPGVTDLPKIVFGGSSSGSKTTTPHGGHTAPTTGGFAQGGVLPGFTPGRDVHHFVSPTAGHLHLSGGEAIMRPEFTAMVGGERGVAALNKRARALRRRGIHHFAGGGVFRPTYWRPTATGSYGAVHDQWTGFPAVDVRVGTGTPVHAVAPGQVTVSEDLTTSYGHWIKLAHAGFQSLYAHLERRLVGLGAKVAGGQLIGYSDSTGNSTGPHLHFGVAGRSPLDFMHASTNYGGAGTPAGASGGGGLGGVVSGLWHHVQGLVGGLAGKLGGWVSHLRHMGPWGKLLTGAVKSMVGGVKDFATGKLSGALSSVGHFLTGSGTPSGSGVQRYAGIVAQVLKQMGESSSLVGPVLRRMGQEDSSGDPRAVNKWDSNWTAGHPSVGLMQVIRGTYDAYAGPYRHTGPFLYGVSTNPAANIYAGLNYARHAYPSILYAMNKPGGYDAGGYIPPGVSTVFNGTGKPEPVLTSAQWADIRKAGATGQAQPQPGVHMENVHVTDLNELVRIQKAAQHKALTMARLA